MIPREDAPLPPKGRGVRGKGRAKLTGIAKRIANSYKNTKKPTPAKNVSTQSKEVTPGTATVEVQSIKQESRHEAIDTTVTVQGEPGQGDAGRYAQLSIRLHVLNHYDRQNTDGGRPSMADTTDRSRTGHGSNPRY